MCTIYIPKNVHNMTRWDFLDTKHIWLHISCATVVSDTPSIIKHESIFQCHTHICCTYHVCQCTVYVL